MYKNLEILAEALLEDFTPYPNWEFDMSIPIKGVISDKKPLGEGGSALTLAVALFPKNLKIGYDDGLHVVSKGHLWTGMFFEVGVWIEDLFPYTNDTKEIKHSYYRDCPSIKDHKYLTSKALKLITKQEVAMVLLDYIHSREPQIGIH